MMLTYYNRRIFLCLVATVASVSILRNGRFVPSVDAFTSFHGKQQNQQYSTTSSTTTSTFPLHSSSSSSSFSSFPDDGASAFEDHHGEHTSSRRRTEFTNLGSLQESLERQRRFRQEERNEQRFVKYGDDLWELRKLMNKLSHKLLNAINVGVRNEESEVRDQLRHLEQQDPEFVYKSEMEQLRMAKTENRDADARMHSRNAYAARSCLPQFNLEGLWVGK